MWRSVEHREALRSSDEEFEPLRPSEGDADFGIQHGFRHMASVVKVAIMGIFAVCVVAVIAMSAESRSRTFKEADVRDTVGLQQVVCRDTEGWTNGYALCNQNSYKGVGCTPTGLTCEAYKANRWCVDGVPKKAFAIGTSLNFPELNCCICGGGFEVAATAVQAARPPAPTPALSALSAPPGPVPSYVAANAVLPVSASCSIYSLCVLAGLEGNCCPSEDGVLLGCCSSPLICKSTPRWTNGYSACNAAGVSKEQGCTSEGLTCKAYESQGFCKDGHVVAGQEWTLGLKFNYPEQHCCECGKPPGL